MRFSKRTRPQVFNLTEGLHEHVQAPLAPAAGAEPRLAEVEPLAAPPLQPPSVRAEVTSADPRPLARRSEAPGPAAGEEAPPPAWPVYLIAFAVAVLWSLAPISFAVGYRQGVSPLRDDVFAMAVFALLAAGPAVLVFCAAWTVRQGQLAAAELRRARRMSEAMLTPAAAAAAGAGRIAQDLREEIARASAAAEEARETLLALRDALSLETEKLVESAQLSTRNAREVAAALGRERTEMDGLSQALDGQAARVTDAIAQKAKMVVEAADVAETQLREAEAALAARAVDLAHAAGEARDVARTAGEDLMRHIARLETAGAGVADQVRAIEGGLNEQRAALVALAEALKGDNDAFSHEAETYAATLSEFISQARLSAAEMNERALRGGETLRQLMGDAAQQFHVLAETARAEREEFGHATIHSLETVSSAAAEQRRAFEEQTQAAIRALAQAAEQTREAAASHASTAREQVDQLSEAAFTAGQRANQVFESRLSEARALVEQSARMVEEAGEASARKLEDGAAAVKASLAELQTMVADLEQRALRLPASARGQVDLVRAAVAKGMEELMAQARRTAAEAEAIDAGFQERVRRNFEMLSEAVRLMGAVAVAAPASAGLAAGTARATSPVGPAEPDPTAELEGLTEPASAAEEGALALRPRLRLTPTATDEEFSAVFEAAAGASQPDEPEGEWTWKDLLASIDGAEPEGERLQDQLAGELARMGVEPARLLPAPRIFEIAAVVQAGDQSGARQVVAKLAPAAIRRIARRLQTDDGVRRKVEVYVRRYQTLVADAAARDLDGALMTELLGEEGGRLYLLLDAAAGDIQ